MSCQANQGVEVLHCEVAIFVNKQQSEGNEDADATKPFPSSWVLYGTHPFDQEEIEYSGNHQLYDELRCTPCIEDERCQQ